MSLTPREYYAEHYPYKELVALLTRHQDKLVNCEFAIEGRSPDGDKIYRRYVSVRDAGELRDAVSKFKYVQAFHFGAFYNHGVDRERIKAGESWPTRRVLSFDIDLTDLEFLPLTDADGKVSVEKCDDAYPVSAAAAYILRRVMQQAFGYREILIAYSGRRGVHVHVFDDKAMALNDEARSAVLDYVNCGMEKTDTHAPSGVRLIMDLHGLRNEVYRAFHTYIVGKLGLLEKAPGRIAFLERLNLSSYEDWTKFEATLAPLASDVLRFDKFPTGVEMWTHIEERIRSTEEEWMCERLDCVVLAYVWPRLDAAVTRDIKHLTKVPFSCHASSKRVAAAMAPSRRGIYGFKPAQQAPSLAAWDKPTMDAAVAQFCVAQATGDVDMEDMVGNARPRKARFKRKASPLATCATGSSASHAAEVASRA